MRNTKLLFFLLLSFSTKLALAADSAVTNSLETSPTCDREFVSAYQAKKECLFKSDENQCVKLGLSNKIQIAAAGGLGFLAGKFLDSSLEVNPTTKEKFLTVINEIRAANNDYRKAVNIKNALQDNLANDLSKGKYKKFDDIPMRTNAWHTKIVPTKQDTALWHKAYDLANEKYKKLTEVETNANLKNAMKGVAFSWNIADTSEARVLAKISEVFPEEYNKLKPSLDDRQKLYEENMRSNESANDPKSYEKFKEASKVSAEKLRIVMEKSPQTKLVYDLLEKGWGSSFSQQSRNSLFKTAKDAVSKETASSMFSKASKVAKNLGWGVAVAVGWDSAASYTHHSHLTYYLNSCKTALGLSTDEISFLSNYHLIGDQSIVYQGAEGMKLDCKKFSFNHSEVAIEDAFEKFGGIPKGICNMMVKESNSLDALAAEGPPKISCSHNKYVETVSTGKIFGNVDMFRGGGAVAPYSEELQWPYTRYISQNIGFEDSNKNSPCVVSPDFSKEQNQECIKMQIVSCYGVKDNRCNVVAEAVNNRIGSVMGSHLCPIESKTAKTKEKLTPK